MNETKPPPSQSPIVRLFPALWLVTFVLVLVLLLVLVPHPPSSSPQHVSPWPNWLWMWMFATALWMLCKGVSLRHLTVKPLPLPGLLAFVFWPGMDAHAFRVRRESRSLPWQGGLLSLTAGALLVWVLIPQIQHPLFQGWLGMLGLLLLLHFGFFALLAAGYNRAGYPVRPIMDAPWRARTLSEFWGARWNRAFSDVARVAVFRPLARRFGVPMGTLAGFLVSGLAHELVISVPAGGGYGWPTVYFIIQGLGVLAERHVDLRHKAIGRYWTFAVILAPAFWLFHPPFMIRVIHPFLNQITY